MSTYPVEFSQLEKANKQLKEALGRILFYAKNRHIDIHIESYREAIKEAERLLEK